MKELDPRVLFAVFHEMLGIWTWILPALVLALLIGFGLLLLRERGIRSTRLLRSELLGLLGGAVALVVMARVSSSGFTDAAGPADWLLVAGVFVAGTLATALSAYTVGGWWPRRAPGLS